ncbi:Leucyl/phenylalanyl-tRNA--protein transferase [BD1-7 clade bacterium]|uniref:Leucyl/phenylalanyl-tRNA--protein transferase n=1 Tax=BD1-7 clade bacterium TaxID=2029982 RepID=A0A5S9QMR2_9GAMM|nr:Leucyl/phenylalanyl-tRNA--protein transferase [BD1-7 clade bacterium]
MIPWLDERRPAFPPTDQALTDPDGLLAAGGNLSVNTLVDAYRRGIFPWFNDDDPILWWSPNPRCVVFPDEIHISKSLKKTLRKQPFRITADIDFPQVIDSCAQLRQDSEGTWITDEMYDAYIALHESGHAHSVEAWQGDELVGGLYGIAIGRIFFGESMFSKATDSSKVAFVHLVQALSDAGFVMIDCQVESPHLLSLGARSIQRSDFRRFLPACDERPEKDPWQGLKDNER